MNLYFDNAATSHPKPEAVYRAVDRTLREAGASPGRGGYRQAMAASRLLFEAREAVAALFNIADSSRIVFTSSATEALNIALFGLLGPGDRVVTSTMEHNAVTRPLRLLQERGTEVVKVPADRQGFVNPADIRAACATRPRMVVLTHCSNVTGTRQAIEELGPWCRRNGILLLVDAAQSAGLFDIDVEEQAIDLLAAPGHKGLLGPPGTGLLYLRQGLQPAPLIIGGTGGNSASELPPEELPERLESGTANLPGLAGLKAGVEFLQEQGLSRIRRHEQTLLQQLIAGLQQLPGLRLFGPLDPDRQGSVLSFTLDGRDPAAIAFYLDQDHLINARAGLHCAPDAHRTIGTFPHGTVRVSPGFFTTAEDIDLLIRALADLASRAA
jgi:cysteine desulfurase family protein